MKSSSTSCSSDPVKSTATTAAKRKPKTSDLDRLFKPFLDGVGYKVKTKTLVKGVLVDYSIPSLKLVIFLYGDCWHGNPSIYGANKIPLTNIQKDIGQKDVETTQTLTKAGYRVEVFWENDLKTRPDWCKIKLDQILGESKMENCKFGVGLDVGTMNIVSARKTESSVGFKTIRDVFLDLDMAAKRSLKLSSVDYVERNGSLVVIGDEALTMANLFKRDARRPLSKGVVSSGEIDAQEILSLLVKGALGKPAIAGEHCFFSVPAAPLDDPSQDVIYHTEVFNSIISSLGFTPHPTNEAMAIIYSECGAEKFSGLSISFGSGMANVALAYQAIEAMSFSLARGGDFVDTQSAKAVGKTASQMCVIKEQGVNLAAPEGRDQQAIAMYIKSLISYTLQNIANQFRMKQGSLALPEAIPFIISGGTSKAIGFMDLFKGEFDKIKNNFPIKISEIRQAKDPLKAVANGLMILALEEHEG